VKDRKDWVGGLGVELLSQSACKRTGVGNVKDGKDGVGGLNRLKN